MQRRSLIAGLTASVVLASSPQSLRAASEPKHRILPVRLFSPFPNLTRLTLIAPFTLANEQFSQGLWQIHAHQGQLFLTGGGQPRRYRHPVLLTHAQGIQFNGNDPRAYRGLIQLGVQGEDQLQLINWVDLEDYLLGVVPSEMPPDWPPAALQVQAIASRTLAVQQSGSWDTPSFNPRDQSQMTFLEHLQSPHLLQDSTATQFYGGRSLETSPTTAAVRATDSQILTWQTDPIAALFHSTCGGHTSANQHIFAPPAQPYLQGVSCLWCRESPFYGPHTLQLSKQTCITLFGSPYLKVVEQDPYGRPLQLQAGSQTIAGQDLWFRLGQHLGWGFLPSNRYQITSEDPDKSFYTVVYRGAGHGVGLCQWGARGLALAGRSVERILTYYYPGTRITRLEG